MRNAFYRLSRVEDISLACNCDAQDTYVSLVTGNVAQELLGKEKFWIKQLSIWVPRSHRKPAKERVLYSMAE